MMATNSPCSMKTDGLSAQAELELQRITAAFSVAIQTLEQIAFTPRNKGARQKAYAALRFIETQLEASDGH